MGWYRNSHTNPVAAIKFRVAAGSCSRKAFNVVAQLNEDLMGSHGRAGWGEDEGLGGGSHGGGGVVPPCRADEVSAHHSQP